MAEPVSGIGGSDGIDGLQQGRVQGGLRARGDFTQTGFELREGEFDGVEVGRVAGQKVKSATGALQQLLSGRRVMATQVVEDTICPGCSSGSKNCST